MHSQTAGYHLHECQKEDAWWLQSVTPGMDRLASAKACTSVRSQDPAASVVYNPQGEHDSCHSGQNEGDLGSVPGFGRSPGERKGYPLQYSGLEKSMDCIVHGVANS